MPGQEFDTLLVPEYMGLPDHKVFDFPFRVRNIIRHTGGGVRYIQGFFQYRDVKVRVISLSSAGSTHTCSIAAND